MKTIFALLACLLLAGCEVENSCCPDGQCVKPHRHVDGTVHVHHRKVNVDIDVKRNACRTDCNYAVTGVCTCGPECEGCCR